VAGYYQQQRKKTGKKPQNMLIRPLRNGGKDKGVSPWYARAITLKYNAALNRAEVPLPGREGEDRSRRCL